MADIGFIRYGRWHDMKHALNAGRLKEAVRVEIGNATDKAALFVRGRIRKRIQDGTTYSANAQLTMMLKHTTKPLVGAGADLFNSVTTKKIDWRSAFVGVLRGTSVNGVDMVNIGEIVHEGASIKVTDKMRGMFLALAMVGRGQMPASNLQPRAAELAKQLGDNIKQIRPLKLTTRVIIIPPRHFISSVFNDPNVVKRCQSIWKSAATKALKGESQPGSGGSGTG
jgi:hypothetical protein